MTKFTRFFAISLLLLSMSLFAFADGGDMQGPGSPVPPLPSETQGPATPGATDPSVNVAASDIDVIIERSEQLVCWLLNSL